MKNVFVGIVFLLGCALGLVAATQVKVEFLFKIPAQYLTFSRSTEMQAASKIYYGKRPENGKVLYITGGSLGRVSGNEHSLSKKLTERMGIPIQVYNVASNGQRVPESYSMIDNMPASTNKKQTYVLMTYGGHRTTTSPNSALVSSFYRKRTLMRDDAVRDLITRDNLFNETFMPKGKKEGRDPKQFLAELDKEHTASLGSRWLKYFFYDKAKKLTRKVPPKNIFKDPDVFRKNDYSPVRINGIIKAFKKNRDRYELSHKKYYNILVGVIEKFTPEQAQNRRDFALYFFDKSNGLALKKDYEFAALELPIHRSLHNHPQVYDYRKTFNTQLKALGDKKDFPVYYLDEDIKELDVFHNWTDTGHMSVVGGSIYEKYYIDVLVKFLSGDDGGVYGDVLLNSPASDSQSQK